MRVGENRPLVMGIINVTPDSFSGDGLLPHKDYVARAVAQAEQMLNDGAAILDIGGESSRPGSVAISAEEESRRVIPVIAAIRKKFPETPIAVDTVKADIAEQAVQAGATIINDITALNGDKNMAALVAQSGARVVLMHNRGAGHHPAYEDVVADVARDLSHAVAAALAAGIEKERIILDPGIGFGKTPQQNLALIAHLDKIKMLGFPVLMGVSRKSFIGHALDATVDERIEGTAACVTACVLKGADIIRAHDVKFMARIVKMAKALRDA